MVNSKPVLFEHKRPVRWSAIALGLALAIIIVLLIAPAGASSADGTARTLYVDATSGENAGNCQDPDVPCQSIAYAVGQSASGDTVLIASGTYTENLEITGLALTLSGGLTPGGTAWMPGSAPTIIDGNDVDRVLFVHGGADVLLERLTITGGKAPEQYCWGGGVSVTNGDLTIRSSRIVGNHADCSSGISGGGAGGAADANQDEGPASLTIEDTLITDNFAKDHGSALNAWRATVSLTNTLVTGNGPNVLAPNESDVLILNSTIADNDRAGNAVLDFGSAGTITIKNAVIWSSGGMDCGGVGTCTATYSDVEGGWPGTGNIDADPGFVGAGRYSLQPNSPCVDSGTNDGAPHHDIEQQVRPLDGDGDGSATTDMGAYELMLHQVLLPQIQRNHAP
jgi:hypothetical protein